MLLTSLLFFRYIHDFYSIKIKMTKKLVRVGGGKSLKWKKGQSCVSNAPNTKYREEVKNRFFQRLEGVYIFIVLNT